MFRKTEKFYVTIELRRNKREAKFLPYNGS